MITVSGRLRELGAHLAYTVIANVTVRPSGLRLSKALEEVEAWVRSRYGTPEELRGDPRVSALRKFMWKLGIDPTKTRPSSEALARRILRGGRMPRINNVVDSGNAASVRTMVPIGLYDLDKLNPPLELKLCEDTCHFQPIGGGDTRLEPGTPVLVDSTGLVVHVFPHRDSRVSMIRESTRRVLAVAAGVPGFSPEDLSEALTLVAHYLNLDVPEARVEGGIRYA